MRNSYKILAVLGVVAGAVMIGGVIGWMGGRDWGNDSNHSIPPSTVPQTIAPPANNLAVDSNPPSLVMQTNIRPIAVQPVTEDTNWENAVNAILDADVDDAEKVRRLFALFPQLPEDGQVAVAESLTDLVPDENYAPLGQLLKDASLAPAVQDVLMADALSRPDSLKLPLMLELAQNPDNAKAADAKDILETYLGEDYGSDWAQWQQKLDAWLKENPD